MSADTRRFLAPLEFFAFLVRFSIPFYESRVDNHLSTEGFNLTEFYEFVGEQAHRGITQDARIQKVMHNHPDLTSVPPTPAIFKDFLSERTIVYKQRHFAVDYSPTWLSARRHPEMGGVKITLEELLEHRIPAFYMFRQVATIGEGCSGVKLREIRSSIRLTMRSRHRNFHIMVLDDSHDFENGKQSERRARPDPKDMWESLGLTPCGAGTGVTQFLCEIWYIFETSALDWENVLDALDDICKVQVSFAIKSMC